jgi:hypothetical protein
VEPLRVAVVARPCDQHAFIAAAQIAQAVIWRTVSLGKVERVDRVVPALMQHRNEPARQLGIDEESHDT